MSVASVTIREIVEKVEMYLSLPGTHRFDVLDADRYWITIRVSDHCANVRNQGERRELSFISRRERKSSNPISNYEWLIENGVSEAKDNYQTIAEILADYF